MRYKILSISSYLKKNAFYIIEILGFSGVKINCVFQLKINHPQLMVSGETGLNIVNVHVHAAEVFRLPAVNVTIQGNSYTMP